VSDARRAEDLLRGLAPQVVGALVRRYGHLDESEEAVQEALAAAVVQWPRDGLPDDPRAWLITVASRRLTDRLRSDAARRRREEADAVRRPADERVAPAADEPPAEDDTLQVLLLCCHPALSPPSQVALTLRAVGGLTTAEIAAAYLVPEATLAQRISRAKQRIDAAGRSFGPPAAPERGERLRSALHVLYLIFNEGYTASSGPNLQRRELTAEALRLTRQVHRALPEDGEVAGLLALMLLTDARRAARTARDGSIVPLADQDRSRWDAAAIAEGTGLVTRALRHAAIGPYQLQAAIAAVHAEAPRAEATDWPQILALYGLLERVAPGPMVSLNRTVAYAMVHGPEAGLARLAQLEDDERLARHHRFAAVRAHLLERAGDHDAARAGYVLAARRATSFPERRYLEGRAARLNPGSAR
jgi:RNA polymerase sigma factor (sigma-70 family)